MKHQSALDACLALSRLQTALIRRFDGRLGMFHGIGFADFAVLYQLGRSPENKMRRVDLAAAVGVTPSAVTRTLIPLEKIGMVKRESDSRDARVGYAALTKAGVRVLEEATASAEELASDIVGPVAKPQLAALLETFAGL